MMRLTTSNGRAGSWVRFSAIVVAVGVRMAVPSGCIDRYLQTSPPETGKRPVKTIQLQVEPGRNPDYHRHTPTPDRRRVWPAGGVYAWLGVLPGCMHACGRLRGDKCMHRVCSERAVPSQ